MIIAYRDTYPISHHWKLIETISTVILALFCSVGKRRNEIKYFYNDLNKHIYTYLHKILQFNLHFLSHISKICNNLKIYFEVTLKMTSPQVVKTSVTDNSPSQVSSHPDDHFQSRYSQYNCPRLTFNNLTLEYHNQVKFYKISFDVVIENKIISVALDNCMKNNSDC